MDRAAMNAGAEMDKLRTLLALATDLKESIEKSPEFDARSAQSQYLNLKRQLVKLDREAESHLPELAVRGTFTFASILREETRIATGQLVAYLTSRLHPKGEERGERLLEGFLLDVLAIIQKRNLTVRWAVSAAMLSLLEVITNQSLSQLGLDRSGDFDKRLNRLSEALKPKGVLIPTLLLSSLYSARSKVVHGGAEPTLEETRIIFQVLKLLHEKTEQLLGTMAASQK